MPTEWDKDPRHDQLRATLRFVGPALALIGLVFTGIGVGSFFSSFGTFEPPHYFWCVFIGLPLMGFGFMICQFAFLGAFFRFQSKEISPVAKDTFNYLAGGASPGVKQMAQAFSEGLAAGTAASCPKCHAENPTAAAFCSACGELLAKSGVCQQCGKANAPGAKFCNHCGAGLG